MFPLEQVYGRRVGGGETALDLHQKENLCDSKKRALQRGKEHQLGESDKCAQTRGMGNGNQKETSRQNRTLLGRTLLGREFFSSTTYTE